jgi:hypothetical protein
MSKVHRSTMSLILAVIVPALTGFLLFSRVSTARAASYCEFRVQSGGGGTCPYSQGNLLCFGCAATGTCTGGQIISGWCSGLVYAPNAASCKACITAEVTAVVETAIDQEYQTAQYPEN